MTRFQIVAIFDDKILTAGEFNGDGYFEEGYGEEVCKKFKEVKTEEDYKALVDEINKNFEYEGQLIYDITNQENLFNFCKLEKENKYYEVWFSDYLYIINLSSEDKEIIDEKGLKIIVKPNGWLTINFGKLYEQENPYSEIKCMYNAEIQIESYIDICESLGWWVKEWDNEISIGKYTSAGEDFSFEIGKDENFVEAVSKYAENFDVDEHVLLWVNSGAQGVPNFRTLLEDAEWIDKELQELAEKLKKGGC